MLECFAIFLRVTGFAPPMSRRQVTNRRQLLLPLRIPDRHQRGVVFDACIPSGPAWRSTTRLGNHRTLGLATVLTAGQRSRQAKRSRGLLLSSSRETGFWLSWFSSGSAPAAKQE